MKLFNLQIVTPEGMSYDDKAEGLIVRTSDGDVGIFANHTDYVTPVGIGTVRVICADGNIRFAACSGGILSVKNKVTRLIANTFEWAEDIDLSRAEAAKERYEREKAYGNNYGEKTAEIKLKKALIRIKTKMGEK